MLHQCQARPFPQQQNTGSEPVQSKVEEEELLAKWRVVRPAMETGWEAAVMIHLLHHSSSTAALLAGFEAERGK